MEIAEINSTAAGEWGLWLANQQANIQQAFQISNIQNQAYKIKFNLSE